MWNLRITWLSAGLLAGLVIGLNVQGIWPQIPVHAVATHGQDNFAICTGFVDEDSEAIYFLDFVTGDLKAAVLYPQTRKFGAAFRYNVSSDLAAPANANPRYLIVTGQTNMRRGAANQMGMAVVYVTEATSGKVAAYGLPWNTALASRSAPQLGSFVLLDKQQFREGVVRQ